MSSWNSLSFGPDFEKDWAFDELSGNPNDPTLNERPLKARMPPSKVLSDDSAKNGKLNRKNCLFSPVQCSFYFKRSVRSGRYI